MNKQGTNIEFITYKNINERLNNIFENNKNLSNRDLEKMVLNEFKNEMKDKYIAGYITDEFINFVG